MQGLEKLSCEVETYPCLHDKRLPAYKKMIPKKYMLGHELMIGQALIKPIYKIFFISF